MFPPTLFRLVTRFARVRIEDSSRNRFASTHISRKARQHCFHAYFPWGECSGGERTGVEPSGGNIPVSLISTVDSEISCVCCGARGKTKRFLIASRVDAPLTGGSWPKINNLQINNEIITFHLVYNEQRLDSWRLLASLHQALSVSVSDFEQKVTMNAVDLFTSNYWLLLYDDNKVKMARKPGKKRKENPVGCTGEGRR